VTRRGTLGLAATGLSIACTLAVALAGPSLMEPALPGRPGQPPWSFDAHLSPYLAVGLTATGIAAGTLGLWLTMRAMRAGWTIPARFVLLAGIVAAVVLVCMPPFGSSDHLSYAGYGRMLVTGHNPYTAGPDSVRGDPVTGAVQDWAGTPSVYGALATGIQGLASLLGGTSVRLTVFFLGLVNLAAFAGTGLLLHRLTRGDRGRQLRAATMWTCNPLLLQVLVAGAHVDSQAIVFGVAAIAVLPDIQNGRAVPLRSITGRAIAAGALAGLGFAIKPTMALIGAGMALAMAPAISMSHRHGSSEVDVTSICVKRARASRKSAVAGLCGLAAGFAVVAGAATAVVGGAGFAQSARASSMVSIATPWRLVRTALHQVIAESTADDLVRAGAVVLAVALAVLLLTGLPREPGQDLRGRAGRAAFALALAWLFAWPYVLPWYDALGWALLPLVATSAVDWLLLVRTAALAFGYLPARATHVTIPGGLHWLESVVRTGVVPVVLAVVIVMLVVIVWRESHVSTV
jgi:hypothetical protein